LAHDLIRKNAIPVTYYKVGYRIKLKRDLVWEIERALMGSVRLLLDRKNRAEIIYFKYFLVHVWFTKTISNWV
jgi:hypothetical protein